MTHDNRFPHHRLDAYRVALRLVRGVEELVRRFPRGQAEARDQLRRAAASVVRNLAEGVGRSSTAERTARFGIARGEVFECEACLEMALVLELANPVEITRLRRLAGRVSAMLLGLIRRERR